jgi:hypothetical protein
MDRKFMDGEFMNGCGKLLKEIAEICGTAKKKVGICTENGASDEAKP